MSNDPFRSPQTPSDWQPSGPNNARSAVSGPATALMIVAGICIALMIPALLFDIFLIGSGMAERIGQPDGIDPVQKVVIRAAWGLVLLVASIFVFWGGLQMSKLRSYSIARTAAIVACIPCVGPCCLLGIPAGAWALTVLNRPDVKSSFVSE